MVLYCAIMILATCFATATAEDKPENKTECFDWLMSETSSREVFTSALIDLDREQSLFFFGMKRAICESDFRTLPHRCE